LPERQEPQVVYRRTSLNATRTSARFQKLKHPLNLKRALRTMLEQVELEDDPKFDVIDDAQEYPAE
jgi:hypothetical protein